MTVEDFFRLTLRNLFVLIASILVCMAAAFGYYKLQTPIYQATALGYVSLNSAVQQEGPIGGGGNQSAQYTKAQTYISLFQTRKVGEGIVKRLNLEGVSPDEIASTVNATLDPNAPVIKVTANNAKAKLAQEIANAAVESAADEARRIETGRVDGQPPVILVPYQTALQPGAPIAPVLSKFLIIGLGVGIVLGYAIAFLRYRADTRVRSVEDVEKKLDLPVFAVVPESKELKREKGGKLPEPKQFAEREALRKLRTNIRFLNVDNPPRVIVVSSAIPAEGKSTVSGNLARVLARAGEKTLLIDADLRRPVVHTEFDLDGSVGLTQLISGRVGLDAVIQKTDIKNLHVLPAGQIPPNPSELLGSHRMQQLLAELRKEYFVILDAPPILPVTDASLLARLTDGAILVISSGRSRQEALQRAVDNMDNVGADVLGAVLNRASTKRISRIAYGDAEYGYGSYGYGAGYGYGSYGEIPDSEEVMPEQKPTVQAPSVQGSNAEPGEPKIVLNTTTAAPSTHSGSPTVRRGRRMASRLGNGNSAE